MVARDFLTIFALSIQYFVFKWLVSSLYVYVFELSSHYLKNKNIFGLTDSFGGYIL